MKSIKNLFGILLALVLLTTLYSCKEEIDYTPAEPVDTDQVYFPSTNAATIELSSLEQSFQVAIARVRTDDAASVPITAVSSDLFTIPAVAAFDRGEATSTITITYDPDAVGFDNYTDIKLTVGGEAYTTPYGLAEYTVKVGIPAPWKSLGRATFIEDFVTTFFAIENVPYQVEIQENQLAPGFFRLVNPFGAAYPYNDPGDWDTSRDWYLEIHAEDPTAVYMAVQETGMDWGYGMFSVGSLAGYYMSAGQTLESQKAAGNTGTFLNGVITFPSGKLLVKMADYQSGGLYYANNNAAFAVAMPGVVLADYSLEVAYAGRYTDAKDNVAGALAQIVEVGPDVETIRLAVVKGTNIDIAVAGIIDGSIESVEAAPKAATIQLPFADEPVEGRYTIVAVAYGNGEAQTDASAEFKYTPPSSSETWTAVAVGDYAYTVILTNTDGSQAIDRGLTLYQSDTNPNRWKIEQWAFGVDFVFTYNQATGEVLVADQEIGYIHPSWGAIYVDDIVDYTNGNTSYGKSGFANGVFTFALVYYISAGVLGNGNETFTLTAALTPGAANAPAAAAAPWVDKKLRPTATLPSGKFLLSELSAIPLK
jgi:hypothetical protein